MMTVRAFCAVTRISTRHFHLKAKGLGPDLVRLGRSIRITEEAAQERLKKHTPCGLSEMLITPMGDMK